MKANCDIRNAITAAGLKCWQVAEAYGITDGNFSRLLRTELPDSKKREILSIINELSDGKQPEVCAENHEPDYPFEDDNSSNPAECFRRRLKYLVVFNQISYRKIALSIGISPQRMSKFVCGRTEPNLTILCKVADYFGVSTDYLLGREAK